MARDCTMSFRWPSSAMMLPLPSSRVSFGKTGTLSVFWKRLFGSNPPGDFTPPSLRRQSPPSVRAWRKRNVCCLPNAASPSTGMSASLVAEPTWSLKTRVPSWSYQPLACHHMLLRLAICALSMSRLVSINTNCCGAPSSVRISRVSAEAIVRPLYLSGMRVFASTGFASAPPARVETSPAGNVSFPVEMKILRQRRGFHTGG